MNTTHEASHILGSMDALADVTRSRLLLLLEEQELTVSELQAVLQQPQSTVSRHLKILGTAGWVVSRVQGTSRWYSVDQDRLHPTAARLWQAIKADVQTLPAAAQDAERTRSVLTARRMTSKAFFSSAAGEWDALRRDLFGANAELTGLLGLLDDRWVVGDLGCGTGQITARLAPFVHRVIAVDDSVAMLEAAEGRLTNFANVEIRHGELEAPPLEDDELDVAILFLVLHHIIEPVRVIAQARRALRPGGRLLIVDMMPHDREQYRKDMGHAWQGFSQEVLSAWLTEAGFEPRTYQPLPAEPSASGPVLFAATAVCHSTVSDSGAQSGAHTFTADPPTVGHTSS
jgi:SAM-dependent methyltransferase